MRIESIHGAVGPSKSNLSLDVTQVQQFLNMHTSVTRRRVHVNGHYGPETDFAIRAFQREVLGMTLPDGIVAVGSLTMERLQRSSMEMSCRAYPWLSNSCKQGIPSDADYAGAAATLECEVAAMKAVAKVESGGNGGFYPEGRPVILFERHIFHKNTGGVFDRHFPDISNRAPRGYGDTAVTEAAANHQYGKLERAYYLDPDGALEAASWGAFQMLGESYDLCGFQTVEDMVKAMTTNISKQLAGFVSYVQSKHGAVAALRSKDWLAFARAYNGRDQVGYDTRMRAAYAAEHR